MKQLLWLKSRLFFYPTLWWNMLLGRWLKVRNWYDFITPNVIVGAFPFTRDIPGLAKAGVGAVVNTCEEYSGPKSAYQEHGIVQLYIPTIDFTHPAYDDVSRAVVFIEEQIIAGKIVYIHCKAGRGRSATVAICWLMQHFRMSANEAQRVLLEKRPHINPRLPSRPVVQQFEREVFANENVRSDD